MLYKHREIAEADDEVNVLSEESEDEDEYKDYENSNYNVCNREHNITIFFDNYKQSVSQIRKIYWLFKKFPARNTILQLYQTK